MIGNLLDVPSGCPSYSKSTDSLRSLSSFLVGSSPTSPASSCWMLLLRYVYGGHGDPPKVVILPFTRHLRGRNEFYNPSRKHWAKEWLSQLPFATPRPTVYHGSPNETSQDRNGLRVHHSPRSVPSLSPKRGCYESSPPHPETVKHRENYSQVAKCEDKRFIGRRSECIYIGRGTWAYQRNWMKLVECGYKHHVVQLLVCIGLQAAVAGQHPKIPPVSRTKCQRLLTRKVCKCRIFCQAFTYTLFLVSVLFWNPAAMIRHVANMDLV